MTQVFPSAAQVPVTETDIDEVCHLTLVVTQVQFLPSFLPSLVVESN